MICTTCGHSATKVIDSRESRDSVRRRRQCLACQGRFTTYERVYNPRIQVLKRSGRREPFSTEKLSRSIQLACVKRPIPNGAIDNVVDEVREAITLDGRECIETNLIGEMALQKLIELDHVAYMRYASVYRDFDDPERFAIEANRLQDTDSTDELLQGRLVAHDALYELKSRNEAKAMK